MDLLGIDGRGNDADRRNPNWTEIRSFFQQKLQELKQKRDDLVGADDGQKRFYGSVLDEVIDTLERQLAEISFSAPVMRQGL